MKLLVRHPSPHNDVAKGEAKNKCHRTDKTPKDTHLASSLWIQFCFFSIKCYDELPSCRIREASDIETNLSENFFEFFARHSSSLLMRGRHSFDESLNTALPRRSSRNG